MTQDRPAATGPDDPQDEHRAAFEAGAALARELARELPRDHRMYEEPALIWRAAPGR